MSIMKFKLIFNLFLLFSYALNAQNYFAPLWGKVSADDLNMRAYTPDSSAAAVVLLHNGFLSVQLDRDEWKSVLTTIHRVKILKKSAFEDYGNPHFSLRSSEKITHIRAQTINLDGSKTPVTEFFDEKENRSWSRKKFAFPKLQEGSIVEYEYTKESPATRALYPWFFQSAIPIRHAELLLDFPIELSFVFLFNGPELKRDSVVKETNSKTYKEKYYRYALDTVEAMKPESYITTMCSPVPGARFPCYDHAGRSSLGSSYLQSWSPIN